MSAPPPAQRRSGGSGCLLPIVVAVAAAVVVIVVAVIVRGGGDDDSPDDPIAAVLEDLDAIHVQLEGEIGLLAFTYSPGRDDAVISGTDIAAPEGDDVYALWRTAGDGAAEPVETFRPDGEDTVTELIEDVEAPGDAVYTVTVESPTTVDGPTGSVVASS